MVLAVLFSVSNGIYALPCQNVVEVVPLLGLRRPASAPAWLAGDFAYRGTLVSVIDACSLLGGYACSRRLSSRLALVSCDDAAGESASAGRIWGIMAERMTAVRRIQGTELSAAGAGLPYFGPVVQQGSQLIQQIDVSGLIAIGQGALSTTPLVGGADDPH